MTTSTDIANRALLQSGARVQIAGFNEGSVESNTCNLLYEPTFTQIARAARWGCLRFQAPLALLKAAQGTPENPQGTTLPFPPQPWLYEYLIPADCLFVRYLQPTFQNPPSGTVSLFPTPASFTATAFFDRQIPYAIATDTINGQFNKVILTNLSQAQLVYTQNNSNPDFWDSQFQAAYVASLAAFLIPPLNLNMGLLNMQIKIANQIISEARSADGNEAVVSQNREAEWIVARGAGEYIGNGWGQGCTGGYPQFFEVAWPTGI